MKCEEEGTHEKLVMLKNCKILKNDCQNTIILLRIRAFWWMNESTLMSLQLMSLQLPLTHTIVIVIIAFLHAFTTALDGKISFLVNFSCYTFATDWNTQKKKTEGVGRRRSRRDELKKEYPALMSERESEGADNSIFLNFQKKTL